MRKMITFKLLGVLVMAASFSFGQTSMKQPRITGIAHIAYYVSGLSRARAYYHDFLGFDEVFDVKKSDGSVHIAYFKINDHQFIELYVEPSKNYGFIHDIAFQTNDAGSTRLHFASLGVHVPDRVSRDEADNLSFNITDPSGYTVRIIQYVASSQTGRTVGKFMPDARISTHIDHIGVLSKSRSATGHFYAGILDSEYTGANKMLVGAGPDRFEIGYERKQPPKPARFHIKNHICLSVPDVPMCVTALEAKPIYKQFRPIEQHVLSNGKHVAELYDPDGNRVELMEPPKKP